ncbi:Leukocyte receptor cluster member 9 [Dissostichus eleginoides]|uniref:Leukocyte receptor cluster member 9 n=1 Tax=Dissostichus eleginoides TaxID=100907 RepID=A0AAD9F7Q5_DISEL|nr:Leukocyte receptor cluster member 9 [Dissostichus eleginoides]
MASDGLGGPLEDQAEEGTPLTETTSEEAGVPPNCGKDTLRAPAAEQDENRVDVCRFFLMGKCHFGPRCRFSHSNPSGDDSGSADQDDKQEGEKTEKHKKKVNKTRKPKYEPKEVNKKPRMRTADEVISRILWDQSADGSEFVVGYVDRFLGVLERPFNDFNWDTDPCDCDYTVELALPRHRIQYFTYRGHRVWDRHSRTDRVFGSTGQSLAPPFGGVEEVKEVNTEEPPPAVREHLQDECETEEGTPTENTHQEEEEQSEMNIQSPAGTEAAPECGGDASPGEEEPPCVMEEAAMIPEASSEPSSFSQKDGADGQEGNEEGDVADWQESSDGKEDASGQHSCHPVRLPAAAGGDHLRLPSSAPHWQWANTLHVTMCLLNLPGPAEVATAAEVLRKFAHFDRNPPVALTFPVRLKHFNGKVLYLSPQPQIHLQQLNSGLQEAYREEGLLHRDSFNPRYHLTLAKVLGKEGERVFDRVGDLKVGKGLHFGRLPINILHLCAMGISEGDDFYETVCTVSLR